MGVEPPDNTILEIGFGNSLNKVNKASLASDKELKLTIFLLREFTMVIKFINWC